MKKQMPKPTLELWCAAVDMAMTYARIEEQPICFGDDITVTPREIHTIYLIGSRKRTNVTDVARFFKVSKSAASQMVSKLVVKGYVHKENPQENQKEYLLALTSNGRRAFGAHQVFHERHMMDFDERLKSHPRSQQQNALEVLRIIGQVMRDRLDGLAP